MENPEKTPFHFCPRCGSEKFLQDSDKSFCCKACGFRYFLNMSAAVAAIIRNPQNEILFTVRRHDPAKGKLDLPGGFADPGETAEEALVREIKEELNLDVKEFRYLRSFPNHYPFGGFVYQTLDMVFECAVANPDEIIPADDVCGYRFIDIRHLDPEEIGLPSIRNIVQFLR